MINPDNFNLNITRSTKLNLNSKFDNEKEKENKIIKLGLQNNEEFSINNQSNKRFIFIKFFYIENLN